MVVFILQSIAVGHGLLISAKMPGWPEFCSVCHNYHSVKGWHSSSAPVSCENVCGKSSFRTSKGNENWFEKSDTKLQRRQWRGNLLFVQVIGSFEKLKGRDWEIRISLNSALFGVRFCHFFKVVLKFLSLIWLYVFVSFRSHNFETGKDLQCGNSWIRRRSERISLIDPEFQKNKASSLEKKFLSSWRPEWCNCQCRVENCVRWQLKA